VIEEKKSHEQHQQQIIAFYYPWEIKEPKKIFDGEQILEIEIEEFPVCLDPLCIQECKI